MIVDVLVTVAETRWVEVSMDDGEPYGRREIDTALREQLPDATELVAVHEWEPAGWPASS